MNLEEQWKELGEGDTDLSSLIKKGVPSAASKDPLQKLKRNLLLNSIMGTIISIGYILVLVRFPVWPVLICIGLVFLFTIWATGNAFLLFVSMNKINDNNSVLGEMKRHYEAIKKWMGIQQRVGLLIYPVSAAGGFLIGGMLGSGKPIAEFMNKPAMLIALAVITAVLVPVCYYLAKWLSKKAFGEYADQLKQNIEMLQKQE